mmetsp:Transcript_33676/g.66850  ORF Transcript_33676/g.66850 Transcript_33676/m.66850 type:complete len:84 (+) Transcript_33676:192-443(+)
MCVNSLAIDVCCLSIYLYGGQKILVGAMTVPIYQYNLRVMSNLAFVGDASTPLGNTINLTYVRKKVNTQRWQVAILHHTNRVA